MSSGIIIYRRSDQGPKFLLLYHGSGYWNFPKGKLEEGERSFRAAVREVREETGIGAAALRFRESFRIHDKYVFVRQGSKILKLVTFYLAESLTHRVHVSEEHEGYGWFLHRDAIKLLKHKNLHVIIRRAHEASINPAQFSGGGVAGGRLGSPRPVRNLRRYRPGDRSAPGGAGGGTGAQPEPRRS